MTRLESAAWAGWSSPGSWAAYPLCSRVHERDGCLHGLAAYDCAMVEPRESARASGYADGLALNREG